MHLIISIDLSSPGFSQNPGEEAARILHRAAEQLATMHRKYAALNHENPAQLHLHDKTSAFAGYVSTVRIDDIDPNSQERICRAVATQAAAAPSAGTA